MESALLSFLAVKTDVPQTGILTQPASEILFRMHKTTDHCQALGHAGCG